MSGLLNAASVSRTPMSSRTQQVDWGDLKPRAEARTVDQVRQAVQIWQLALLKPRRFISTEPQDFSAIQDDAERQESMFIHMNKLREVRVTFVGGFSPSRKRLVLFMFRYVTCVSESLGKSLLELIRTVRETWHGLGRSRQRNAFHCSCKWANTFSRDENGLRCIKHWQMLSQMRRSVRQPSRRWMNELWQKPRVTTGLDTSPSPTPPLSNSLTFAHSLFFILRVHFSLACSFLSPPPTVTLCFMGSRCWELREIEGVWVCLQGKTMYCGCCCPLGGSVLHLLVKRSSGRI